MRVLKRCPPPLLHTAVPELRKRMRPLKRTRGTGGTNSGAQEPRVALMKTHRVQTRAVCQQCLEGHACGHMHMGTARASAFAETEGLLLLLHTFRHGRTQSRMWARAKANTQHTHAHMCKQACTHPRAHRHTCALACTCACTCTYLQGYQRITVVDPRVHSAQHQAQAAGEATGVVLAQAAGHRHRRRLHGTGAGCMARAQAHWHKRRCRLHGTGPGCMAQAQVQAAWRRRRCRLHGAGAGAGCMAQAQAARHRHRPALERGREGVCTEGATDAGRQEGHTGEQGGCAGRQAGCAGRACKEVRRGV